MKKALFLFLLMLFLAKTSFAKAKPLDKVILERPLGVTLLSNGNFLVADGGGRDWTTEGAKIIEISKKEGIIWSYQQDLNFPHKAIELKNGNILIADTGNNRLLEVTRKGELVWSTDEILLSDKTHLNRPKDILEITEGVFLIADTGNARIVKIDKKGKILFEKKGFLSPSSIDFREGNVLIAETDGKRVIELDQFGRGVWTLKQEDVPGSFMPVSASYLESNERIIVDKSLARVFTVSPEKKLVFELKEGLSSPFEALELGDKVLISDSDHSRIIEVNAQKDISWRFQNAPVLQAGRFSNGDFEIDKNKDNIPDNWYRGDLMAEGGANFSLSSVANSGQKSARIFYDGYGYAFFWQRVKVRPGQDYSLLGVIKSQDFKGVARFEVLFLDSMGGRVGDPAVTPAHFGTTDWTRYETVFVSPEGVEIIEIRCLVDGIGEVWFDELSFRQVGWQKQLGIKLSLIIMLAGAVLVLAANRFIKA